MPTTENLKIALYADGAVLSDMREMYALPYVKGFTTNPTLMRKAGITDYEGTARRILEAIPDRPISFEVFSDEFDEMERQALKIASWGPNVNVKIPVTNTRQEPAYPLIERLAQQGVKLNVTAILSMDQVRQTITALEACPWSIISVFAGRIADTGRDPVPFMKEARERIGTHTNMNLLWASPRELLNIFQADAVGCHIITATNDIIKKLALVGRDLDEYSLDTVKMFYRDAVAAGFRI
jgi:transaldolase